MNSQSQQVFSNSAINIYSQEDQVDDYNVVWSRKQLKGDQNSSWVVRKSRSYLCSPLDVDYYIEASIQQENKPVEIKLYGPVKLQPKMIYVESHTHFQVKTILNKNVIYNGTLNIEELPKIIMQIQSKDMIFQFGFFMQDSWNKLACPAEQPQSIILNIKSIKKQFLQFLKQLKIFMHLGDTLKINFVSNDEKNLFLYELVQYKGSYKKVNKKLVNMPSFQLQQPKTINEKFDIPILESQDEELNCDTKILEDLYDVIYTPTAKKGPKIFQNPQNQQKDKAKIDDKFINNGEPIDKTKEKKSKKLIRGTTKQTNGAYYLDQLRAKQRFYSQRDQQSDYLHNNNHHEIRNVNPMQEHIIKMNNFLMSENERLRRQNELLKQDKQKLQKTISDNNNNKINELKSMIETMHGQMFKLTQNSLKIAAQHPRANEKKNIGQTVQLTHQNSKRIMPVFLKKPEKANNFDAQFNKKDTRLSTNPQLNKRTSMSPNSKILIGEGLKLNLARQQKK